MVRTVTLHERHFKAAAGKARELGKTPRGYIESLIEAATMTFDEILAPVRDGFTKGAVTEDELDDAVAEARKAIYHKAQRKSRQ